MAAYIPSGNRSKKYLDNFVYDDKTDSVICQRGYSPISKTRQEEGYLYVFSTRACKNCENKGLCPKPNNGRIRLFISDNHKLIDNTQERKESLVKRKMIERKFAEAKKWHSLRRARYRGKWRVAIQVLMTFLVMNAKRIARLLKEKLKTPFLRGALATGCG